VVQLVDTVVTALAAILAVMFRRILCLIPLLLPLSAEAETLVGKVVGVTDGDTIKVLVEERTIKARLAEIDTPESEVNPGHLGQSRLYRTRCSAKKLRCMSLPSIAMAAR
jgi:endonuclease YncB( thermonuclease family)